MGEGRSWQPLHPGVTVHARMDLPRENPVKKSGALYRRRAHLGVPRGVEAGGWTAAVAELDLAMERLFAEYHVSTTTCR